MTMAMATATAMAMTRFSAETETEIETETETELVDGGRRPSSRGGGASRGIIITRRWHCRSGTTQEVVVVVVFPGAVWFFSCLLLCVYVVQGFEMRTTYQHTYRYTTSSSSPSSAPPLYRSAVVIQQPQQQQKQKKTVLHSHLFSSSGSYHGYENDDGVDVASTSTSTSTRQQQQQREREKDARTIITIPIVIMNDCILPNQTLHFSSQDPKFDALMQYVLLLSSTSTSSSSSSNEIGILGLDPVTRLPLNVGVTAPIVKKSTTFGINKEGERVLATTLKGARRFRILLAGEDNGDGDHGRAAGPAREPWMDPTESFYIANVQILDDSDEQQQQQQREEELLSLEQQQNVQYLHHQVLPKLVQEWVETLIQTEKLSPAGVTQILKPLGPMPSTPRERAFWMAAALNPTLPLALCPQEIRPAMLSCHNDYDRVVLASVAMKTSIDFLWKEKKNKDKEDSS